MAEEDDAKAQSHNSQIQKQQEALAKARSVVQRLAGNDKSSKPELSTKSPPPITYPEFAPLQQAKVTPLVTFRRLLLVLYLSAGTATTLYLVSKVCCPRNLTNQCAAIPAALASSASQRQAEFSTAFAS